MNVHLGKCSTMNSPPGFFFLSEESRTQIPLSRPGSVHSGSASWDDCGRVLPDELPVSSLPDRFPHYACGIISPLRLRLVLRLLLVIQRIVFRPERASRLTGALNTKKPTNCPCPCELVLCKYGAVRLFLHSAGFNNKLG